MRFSALKSRSAEDDQPQVGQLQIELVFSYFLSLMLSGPFPSCPKGLWSTGGGSWMLGSAHPEGTGSASDGAELGLTS